MVIYGTTNIPSDQIEVVAGQTTAISAAFENSIGLVGGMDTSNGTAQTGSVVEVTSSTDAADKFGTDSELHEAVQLAFQNGAAEIWALPVAETVVTAETKGVQDDALDNVPAFDPRVNEEHDITATDTGVGDANINLVDSPPTSAPSTTDQIDLYPPTGEFYADAAPDGDYEFDYDYGDYSQTEIAKVVDKDPRIVAVLTENASVTNDLATELNNRATDFNFYHGVTGAIVDADPATYTDGVDERRISMVYPPRGFTDSAATNEERTAAAVGGYLASLPLGPSSTNDSIGGFQSLKNDLSGPSEAGDMIDEQIMPLLDYPPVTIVKDMTTSTEAKFERVYGMQIIDEATEISHLISRNFIGELNTVTTRSALRDQHQSQYNALVNSAPPLLDDFEVAVSEDQNNADKVNVDIGIDVVDVMDIIDVTITVGDVVRNNGAN